MRRLLFFLVLSLPCYGQILAPILSGASGGGGAAAFTVVQHVVSPNTEIFCNATCSLTIASVTAGNKCILIVYSRVDAPLAIKGSTLSGPCGTWTHPGGDSTGGSCNDASGHTDCATTLSAAGGAGPIQWQFSDGAAHSHVEAEFYEIHLSSGSATVDGYAVNDPVSASGSQAAPAITLTGSNDVIACGAGASNAPPDGGSGTGYTFDFSTTLFGAAVKPTATTNAVPTFTSSGGSNFWRFSCVALKTP